MCYNGVSNQKNDTSNDKQMRMLRGVWVPCWRDVAGLAAPPFEARGADSVSWITGVVSWLLRGVCETVRHRGAVVALTEYFLSMTDFF